MEKKQLESILSEAIENMYELLGRAALYDHGSKTYYSLGSESVASAMRFLIDIGSAELVEELNLRNIKIKRRPVPKDQSFGPELRRLQKEIGHWSWENFGSTYLPYDLAPLLGAVEELGELCRALLKAAQGIRGEYHKHMEKVKDSLGDLVIYLMDFCERNRLDLWECITKAWSEVRERDWRTYPKDGKTE